MIRRQPVFISTVAAMPGDKFTSFPPLASVCDQATRGLRNSIPGLSARLVSERDLQVSPLAQQVLLTSFFLQLLAVVSPLFCWHSLSPRL
jgi:hypothetical protein